MKDTTKALLTELTSRITDAEVADFMKLSILGPKFLNDDNTSETINMVMKLASLGALVKLEEDDVIPTGLDVFQRSRQ